MKNLTLILLFLLFSLELSAQSFYNYKRGRDFIASYGTGTSTYFGDLKDQGDYIDPKVQMNIGLAYIMTDRINLRSEVQWFQLEGADEESEDNGKLRRNLSFVSNNFEFNVVGMVSLFKTGSKYYQRPKFNIYGFAGVAMLYFNPTADYNGEKYALQPIQTEGVSYSRVTIALPYGIGIKYKVSPFVNIGMEGGFRQTFTDYLDDVSSQYIDNTSFADPIHAALADRRPEIDLPRKAAGSKRGNPEKNDNYFLLNLKVEYYLPPEFLSIAKMRKGKRRKGKKSYRRR